MPILFGIRIEQTIIDALSISKLSKVPLLLISNPGYGKTTILQKYSMKFSYHLETLIGSRFSPEEILGFQVNNGGEHLQHFSPEWFCRVWEYHSKGISTILFLDEISCASEAVQGPLLTLVFDRTIGSEKYLPEDTLIVSAANYSANLSSYMNLLSPTINRVAVVNLMDNYTGLDLVDEFLGINTEVSYPSVQHIMTGEIESNFNGRYKELWKKTFIKYGDPEAAIGIIDILNPKLGDLYSSSERNVYNFISGRTLSYLRRMLKAYIELGIDNKELLHKICDGLVGGGTYSFKENEQAKNYRKYIFQEIERLVSKKEIIKTKITLCGDISKDVSSFLVAKEDLSTTPEEDIALVAELMKEIRTQFNVPEVLKNATYDAYVTKFVANFESTLELYSFVSSYPDSKNITQELAKITMDYYGLYCEILGLKPDFEGTFGIRNPLFEKMCLIEHKMKDGSVKYEKAALRSADKFSLPVLYPVDNNSSLHEAGLSKPYFIEDKNIKVLAFKGQFCFIPMEKYLNDCKFKAA